nr:hypothetical protein [Tanacetum cinerariifolium]
MAAGSKDRPPMLAPGRYPQWRSLFLRYVDTRLNGEALRKYILTGPYKPTTVLVQAIKATDNSLAVPEHTTIETPTNMSPENKAHFLAKKEAIYLILTGIGDDIYSTVDACQMAHEMWEAIERLQQGESLNIQDVKINLFLEFGKFTSHDGESMESYCARFYKLMNEMIRNHLTVTTMQVNVQFLQQLQPEWSRFVTIVKQQHKLDEVSCHKLFDILKQYQNKVNELRAEKLARNANPLALVATAQADRDQYYQTSRSHRSSATSPKPSIPSKSHTTTRHKGKEIAKPITPPSETAFEEHNNPKQAQRDKDMQENLALIAKYFKKIYKPTNNNLRTSSNSKNKNVDMTPRYKNDDHFGQCETQRTVNVDAAREKVGSPVVQKSGIQCFNFKEYGHFAKECRKPKRVKDFAYHKEKMLLCKQAEQGVPLQAEQYDWLTDTNEEVDEQELEAHYSYMAKIQEVPTADSRTDSEPVEHVQNEARYNVFANHLQHFEQSESNEQNDVESDDEHVALANLIANLKLDVDENKKIQKQLMKEHNTCSRTERTKQIEFEKYKAFNDRTIYYDKLERKLNEALGQLAHKDTVIREVVDDDAWTKHSKDLFRAPTTQDMKILIQTCLMPFTIKTQSDSLKFIHELKQEIHADLKYVESLEKEIDKLESEKAEFSDMYDVILQDCVSKDVMCSYLQSLSDLDALAELQYLKAQMQDKNIAISELRKLIEKGKGKSVDTKFDRPSVVRQPNTLRIPKPLVLGKPTPFSNSLERKYFPKTRSVPKANVSEGLSKPVTAQTLPQTAKQAVSNTNVLKLGMYRIDNRTTYTRAPQLPQTVRNSKLRVSTSTRVNHKPNVSRPDGENLDKMKEKGDQCILVGYSTQSKGYRVYNKRTRMIVESIHIRFDEIKELSETSVASSNPSTNVQSTSAPSTHTNVHAEENNNDQAEEGEKLQNDEFTNPFCAPAQEEAESSSHNIGNSNVSTFNKPQVSEYRWTKDHPLEQVRRNPSRPVQTRRKLATDPEMYMYALTMSTAEPKNIKEAMADSTWIDRCMKNFISLTDFRFVNPDHPEKVYRLRKALYGLKNAPRAWYDELSKLLTSKGFTKGLQIYQSPSGIFINQAKYTLKILHKHGMDKGQSIGTPMATKPKLDADLSGNLVDQTDYRSKIRTEYQLADMFTKALPKDRFKYLFRRISMRCLAPAELEVLAKGSA